MIEFLENPRETIEKVLKSIKFSKGEGHKIIIQRLIVFMYTNSNLLEI